MRNFRNLLIWEKAIEITTDVYFFSESLPIEEKFGIRSQITRAAVSMPSNIAEGCSRRSDKEYAHYLEISLGSSFELETQMIICRLINIGDQSIGERILNNLSYFQKMLNVYFTKICNNSTNNQKLIANT
jgi:four helix bundle protein